MRRLALASALLLTAASAQAPRTIAYQGVLDDGGAPVTTATDLTFRLYDAATGGTQVWTEAQTVTPDADGAFAVRLGAVTPLDSAFAAPLWLEVEAGGTPLGPRAALDAVPYALGLYGVRVTPPATATNDAPSVAWGRPENEASGNGAVVGGGGALGSPNTASGNLSTVSGGLGNTADGYAATVSGGNRNTAGSNATVGGGLGNAAEAFQSAIGGGAGNTASGIASTIGGGAANTASGIGSVVPGGDQNHARGRNSLAAGYNARAVHDGTFVWSDNASFFAADSLVSTGEDQFLVRAAGGVGIGTNAPEAQVHVEVDSDARPHLLLDETEPADFARLMFRNGNAAGHFWTLAAGGAGNERFNVFTRGTNVVQVFADADNGGTETDLIRTSAGGASLTQGGVWTNASSRALKTDFLPVDPEAVLASLVDIPITRWRYRAEADDVWHLGPVSQDFHAAFGLGASAESIGTVDADGVALAAVQALHRRAQAQAAEIAAQQARLDAQQAQIEALLADRDRQREAIDALTRRLDRLDQ